MTRVELVRLDASGFRNLVTQSFHPARGITLVLGANGAGKSNLLEAAAMLANLRSFRTQRLQHVVSQGSAVYRLRGRVEGRAGSLKLAQEVEPGPPLTRTLMIDGSPVTAARYLCACPIFVFSAADRMLLLGPPATRRSFLDRYAFLLRPAAWDDLRAYRRTLAQRNAALAGPDDVLGVWEERLAAAAARVVARRREALATLTGPVQDLCRRLAGEGFPEIELEYRGESWLGAGSDPAELAKQYEIRYDETRVRDRENGFTTAGPHRHDLTIHAHGRPARDLLSAGQVKVVAVALGMAAVEQVERARGEHLPVIVDDVDAELDPYVLRRFVGELGTARQLLLSSAHEEMVASTVMAERRVEVAAGSWCEADGERP